MYASNAYKTYKNNSVNYASKDQLLLMLLDGAVKFAKMGRQAILDKKISKAHDSLTRTQDIFFELMATLDVNAAGEWGKQIMGIYEFVVRRLADANMKKDIEIMEDIIPLIENIRNTWYEAEKISRGQR
ncbi:flagellar export chaperone FliS [Clostridium botulinum]|uniref:flagellar export chaperone FliS n=1 Tax=Clostridium botulinum TaxID=1491 RepID=UPI0004D4612C|nr:flagellar export chaperone FliS [Clostridium botulinum]KEI03861.1 flagellar biosynthesis protein FliS [Clostridium botulinum C/D str. BKT75002]KEI09069.1 flagellar biosynthesis protein FliS [Clostridium botulinum C/D str. BKT2873]MCD3349842.1 flagellar export chaperone FliS [Clostridium botulinum D/C]MCD3358960.1 flagellar export chaperone FliS [Clostridium botulinum D/C]MCD3362261.1 flagellar export chaperone FliS [Clostridium botulinum D/C]